MQELGLKDRGEEEAEHECEEETSAPQVEPPKRAPDALLSMAVSPKPVTGTTAQAASRQAVPATGGIGSSCHVSLCGVSVSNGKELTKSEAREKGSVPLSTYITYVKAAQSLLLVTLMLLSFGLASAADKISQVREGWETKVAAWLCSFSLGWSCVCIICVVVCSGGSVTGQRTPASRAIPSPSTWSAT